VKNVFFALLSAGSALGQVLSNPGFDEPHLAAGYLNVPAGSSGIPAWEVATGDVDLLASGYYSGQTTQALDMNGSQAGGVCAPVSLDPGTRYEITFHYRLNPSADRTQTLLASWDGIPYVLVSAEPENDPNRASTLRAASFTIETDGTDSLSFQSLNGGIAGVLLDFATIRQAAFNSPLSSPLASVPEPGAVGAVTALGLLGYGVCRQISGGRARVAG